MLKDRITSVSEDRVHPYEGTRAIRKAENHKPSESATSLTTCILRIYMFYVDITKNSDYFAL
jgi:hypothetical protein